MPATLERNIIAYRLMQDELEANHMEQWVVFYDGELEGTFEDFQDAANSAVTRFGRGPYLIKRVGQEELRLGSYVTYGLR